MRNGYGDKMRNGYGDKMRNGYGDKMRNGYGDKMQNGYVDKMRHFISNLMGILSATAPNANVVLEYKKIGCW